MKRLVLILTLPILVTSCYYTHKYQNRASDLQDAEKVTSELFEYIKQSNFYKVTELFAEEFYEVTTKDDLLQLLESSENKLGVLKSTDLTDWSTMVSVGSIEQGVYNLKYNAEFEYDNAVLNLSLTKNKTGEIRVAGYYIHSDVFLN